MFGARLAKQNAHIDEARRKALTAGIHNFDVMPKLDIANMRSEIGDPPAFDHHIARPVQAARRIEKTRVFDEEPICHAAALNPSVSTSRQAMRTATPSST